MKSPAPTQHYDHDFHSLLDKNEVLSTFMLCFPSPDYALAPMRVYVGVSTDFLHCFHRQSPDTFQTRGRKTQNKMMLWGPFLSCFLWVHQSVTTTQMIHLLMGSADFRLGLVPHQFHKHLAANGVKPHCLPVSITQSARAHWHPHGETTLGKTVKADLG